MRSDLPVPPGVGWRGPGPRPSIVCVSTADWDAPLWTNKQHLMSRLGARGATVVYIDSLGMRAPGLSAGDGRRIVRRVAAWRPTAVPVAPGVLRDSPLVVPLHRHRGVRAVNRVLLRGRLERNARRYRLRDPIIWAYAPPAVDLYDPIRHRALVYHCVDDVAAFPGVDEPSYRAGEKRLVAAATVCIASSRPLMDHLVSLGARRVEYWPNPADVGMFADVEAAGPRRTPFTVGFVGAVQEHKVDIDLLAAVARLRPAWRIELVGPVGLGLAHSHIARDGLPPNVVFTGPVPRADLPSVMARFHVGVIPYVHNMYTAGVFPMKVFEYMAAGLPVVATSLPSLVGEVEHIRFADTPSDFVAELEAAAASGAERDARRALAHRHSWEARTDEAVRLIAELRGT